MLSCEDVEASPKLRRVVALQDQVAVERFVPDSPKKLGASPSLRDRAHRRVALVDNAVALLVWLSQHLGHGRHKDVDRPGAYWPACDQPGRRALHSLPSVHVSSFVVICERCRPSADPEEAGGVARRVLIERSAVQEGERDRGDGPWRQAKSSHG